MQQKIQYTMFSILRKGNVRCLSKWQARPGLEIISFWPWKVLEDFFFFFYSKGGSKQYFFFLSPLPFPLPLISHTPEWGLAAKTSPLVLFSISSLYFISAYSVLQSYPLIRHHPSPLQTIPLRVRALFCFVGNVEEAHEQFLW